MSNVKNFLLKTAVISLLFIMILTSNANAYTRKSWFDYNQDREEKNVPTYTTNSYRKSSYGNYFNTNSFKNGDFSFGNYFKNSNTNYYNNTNSSSAANDVFGNTSTYDLSSLKNDLMNMQDNSYVSKFKLKELVNQLPEGIDKIDLTNIINSTSSFKCIEELLNKISELLGENNSFGNFGNLDFGNLDFGNMDFGNMDFGNMDFGNMDFGNLDFGNMDFGNLDFGNIDFGNIDFGSILGGSTSTMLPEAQDIYITAETAGEFAGESYNVNLHANVYLNENSDNWIILVHPFMLSGESIANSLGDFYYEKGYNVLAPDLRGFGDSDGSVAIGFLEALDIYDWLVELQEYNPEKVFVHGVSLGGATTNFLSGIDGFMNNAPENIRINKEIMSLESLNVKGLIEDCGYTDMTEFSSRDSLLGMDIGLNENNFDYYSNACNSLKYCNLPMMVVHGTGDTTVDVSNADVICDTVQGEVETWIVDGGSHAFIVMGNNKDEYKEKVQSFIDKY